MRKQSFSRRFTQLTKLGVIGSALMFGLGNYVLAQTPATAQEAYEEAIQECKQITDEASRQNCQRDAAAALQEARKNPDKRSEEHTSELQSRGHLVCRLLLE